MIPTNLLPASLYDRAIIAGGYAACPALADDMDVWVLRCEDPSWTREFIIDYWRRQSPLPNVLLVGAHNRVFEIEDETRTVPTYLNERVTINRVGRISGKKPIHVLVTDAEAPEQLIESFDISTHAIAIDTNGRIYTSIYWTSILKSRASFTKRRRHGSDWRKSAGATVWTTNSKENHLAISRSNPWSEYTRATADRRLRTIALISGEVDTGKTRLGLTGPGPILVQSLDQGMEGVVEKILGDENDPAYSPDKEIYVKEYDWNPAHDDFSQEYAVELRDQIKADFMFGLKNASTILWDKETDIWQVFRYAEFGGPSEAPKNYARLNQEYFKLINAAKTSGANFFLIQSMKDEWVSQKAGDGKTKGVQSGRRVRSGFDRLDELVLMEIHCTYVAGEFYFEIGKSKQNKALTGEKLTACTFGELGTLIMPDTTEAQWMREDV